MGIVKIGSRGSKLALWQAQLVKDKLIQLDPTKSYETVIIKTKGDKILDSALFRIGDKGLFTKEIEDELLAGTIDLAVHSMKDVPTVLPDGLVIGAVLERERPWDVFLSLDRRPLRQLPKGKVVGTSSLRRQAQIRMIRPDLKIVNLRGNVDTRIRRMKEEGLDGIVLAYAGVVRMGYEKLIVEELDFLPAVGQGAVAVEMRKGDKEIAEFARRLDDADSHLAVEAERSFLQRLEGGCQIPIAALARVEESDVVIEGLVADLDGSRAYRDIMRGRREDAQELGKKLAERLLDMGAEELLASIRK